MILKLALIASAGAVGTLARYGLSTAAQRFAGTFPLGTLAVNALGCLAAGIIAGLAKDRLSPETHAAIAVGFLGAFTTFSAFAAETTALARGGQVAWAVGNVALQLAVGLALVFAGLRIGRAI